MNLYTKEAALDQIADLLGLGPQYSTEDVVQRAMDTWARGVHSCSHYCTRPLCVAKRDVERLNELAEKWAIDARNASERADAAEARLRTAVEAGDDMREWVQSWRELHPGVAGALVEKVLRRWDAARQQGGAK